MERDPNVVLPDDIARCVPSKPCALAPTCARARAALPKFGASLGDFSLTDHLPPPFIGCREFKPIEWRQRR